MKRQLVAEQWDQFARAVLPVATSGIQRRLIRRAFYAGADAVMIRIITAEDLQVMQDLHDELQAFEKDVKEGRA